jgi:xanthine dehydrogenase accessory factor
MGMIGSKKKVGTLFQRLESAGIALPDYLYAPVGLDLGGDTAAEIAVSIAAEVITIIRGKSGTHLRLEESPENSS